MSNTDPDYLLAYPAHVRLKIQVQQSIEMNTMPADDADESCGLVGIGHVHPKGRNSVPGAFSCSSTVRGQNVTRIHGGARRNSDSYSPV